MSDSVLVGKLPWTEYDALVRDGETPVMLPVGSLEQHGPHMSMNVDVLLPSAVAERVACKTGALVAPPVTYGYKSQPKCGGGNHMPGTTSLDGTTLVLVIRDVIKEFARHGVRKMILVNGHYENGWFLTEGIDVAIRELRWDGIRDMKVMLLSYWDFIGDQTIEKLYPEGFSGWDLEHGGVMETSLMLTLHPELVDMSKVVDFDPPSFPPYDLFPLNPDWVPAPGTLSSAKNATKEKGDVLLDVSVAGIAEAVASEFGAGRGGR